MLIVYVTSLILPIIVLKVENKQQLMVQNKNILAMNAAGDDDHDDDDNV